MQPGRLGVDVVALRTLGSDVAGAAATLRECVTASGSGLAPAAQPGSAAGTAAQAAEKAWSASLERITARVQQLGRKMTEAADTYQVTDQAGADELRRSGSAGL
ncbi:type VII secretion target [Actinoplanes philippinensis]|uniref:type VII secretion target n=1 Tax=Actinoplanes philippinensis TaxID=35752 RepID=UPI0033F064F3